ncbi:PKD domain-containing protein [Epibacterium sp. MM17-32]|uniref:PKD domain-containing protein n=1 Tax=Epibacterium sp. MM17-32 TaxID=2917734 RepID=UPI001EF6410F|nr:PKD domain-containing protein [Epibacterium sp. MM17-32]MCG7630507.1 PKD domain-containing protein [Epibacterium sp. MM17-32]
MEYETTITVSSAEELTNALNYATGGETILLEPGDYGDLDISPKSLDNSHGVYDSTVTIRSANPDDAAVFSSVGIAGGQNIHFADLEFELTPTEETTTTTRLFNVRNWSPDGRDASNITVENSKFTGQPVPEELGGDPLDHEDVAAHGGNVAGMSTGIAFSARGAENVTFVGNEIDGFFRGAVFTQIDNLDVSNNYVHDLRSDGFDFVEVTNVLIEGNEIRDMTPWRHEDAPGRGDHADLIQFWTAGTDSPSENIIIRGNILMATDGDGSQSIFLRNEQVDRGLAGEEMFYRNILIEDNVVYNAVANSIVVGATHGLEINNNTVIQNLDRDYGSVTVPSIRLSPASVDVAIQNNIVPRIANMEELLESGYTISGNLITQNTNPGGENYVGNIFVDALSGMYSSVSDLQFLPDSEYAGQNLGASLTQFDATPDALTPLAVVSSGEFTGNDFAFSFDAGLTADAQGFTDERATYVWDFGDGTQASGQAVNHTYAAPGNYVVTLAVTGEDGTVAVNEIRANVDEPTLFELELTADGPVDGSSYGVGLSGEALADAVVTLEDGSLAYHLNNDTTITLDRSAEHLYSQDQFTFSLDLKRDMDSDGGGYLMMWISSMRLRINDDGFLTFDFWNADEEHYELVSDIAISDTDWHNVAISYNSHNEQAVMYLDGEEIGSAHMEGLTDVQESWGMQLGYTFQDNFEGLIRDVRYLNEATDGSVPEPEGPEEPLPENVIELEATGEIQSGTRDADFILGTEVDDIAKGLGGDDVIYMGEGNDLVNAGDGDDTMYGGAGNDTLRGFEGEDIAFGGEGDDLIYADVAFGEGGNDTLRGDSGADSLSGGEGRDAIIGGAGDDVLSGGNGVDRLAGGAGDDVLIADMEDARLSGGRGFDVVVFAEAADVFEFTGRRVDGIEAMDFTNGLENTLNITRWYDIRQSNLDELAVSGDLGDVVNISLEMESDGQEERDGVTYDRYIDATGETTLLLDEDLTVNWLL